MNKGQFRKLLNWTCRTTTLQFDGKFYHQIDGMAMGSLLAPAMADIFMNWLVETASAKSNHQFTVHRYLDDLFLTFDDPNHIDHVFSTLNSIHQKIKFTKENQENNKLAFLVVQITKNSDCVETSIFRKNTNLGIYTRWDSYVPNRGYSICNSAQLRKNEFQKISNLLEKNGFPLNYINRQIQHFLAKKQSKKNKTDKKDDTKRIFMKLPYIKKMNSHIPKEINGFLKKLDFKVTFILINETFNLKRLFTFKERQNKLHRSSVVYRITCSCKSTYIGKTSRNLITRLKNHAPNSPNRQDTDVSKHLTDSPDHKIDFDKTEIMAQTNHCRKLLITKTLLIQIHNPNLNVDRTSIPLYLFNT